VKKRKIRFAGLLTNTDSSILDIKLEHGFKIEDIGSRELIELIIKFENIPEILARVRVTGEKPYLNLKEDKGYIISNLIDDFAVNVSGELDNDNFRVLNEYDNTYANGYLYKSLSLMRLFKEGHIFMPDRYYFFDDDKSGIMAIKTGIDGSCIDRTIYTLQKSELTDLQTFLSIVRIPFEECSLRLAHDNFEISYSTNQEHLAFLTCMMSMESLFNPSGEGELRYRIARNTAVLIGKDKNDSESIWKRMKYLYDIRCDVVHAGKTDSVNNDDVIELRGYVRRSIKEFYKIGKSKQEVIEMLTSCGFGDKPWR